jgi:hypothetical protein
LLSGRPIKANAPGEEESDPQEVEDLTPPPIEDWLVALMRMTQESIQPVAPTTVRARRELGEALGQGGQ